jgi:hypothetical protein
MENEKTIWNKTIFSESPHKYDDNFQIMNMQYKLKNSKKKRKENYKNIELLENIYDNTEENIEGFKAETKIAKDKKSKEDTSKTEGYNEDYTSADTVGYGNLTKTSKSKEIDPNFLGLPDKDYDGVDRPDKGNKDDPRVALIRSINNVFGAINKFNYKIALVIAKTLSRSGKAEDDFGELLRKGSNARKTEKNNSYTTKDVVIIQKYIGLFESILVAFFATYNWFYIMFYYYTESDCKDMDCNMKESNADTTKETEADTTKETEADTTKETEADTTKETEADTTKESNADTTKESHADEINETLNEMTNTLLGRRIKIPKLNSFFIQNQIHGGSIFSSIFCSFVNNFFIFALAFVECLQSIMIDIIPKYAKQIFNYKGCFVIVFCMLVMFFYYCNTLLHKFLIDVLTGNTRNLMVGIMYFLLLLIYFFGNYNFGKITKTTNYTTHTFMDFILSPTLSIIMAFMRFIIIMLVSVPLGAIACVFYILFNSLFGILFNTGILKYFGTYFRINDFIKDNNDPEANKDRSGEEEFIYKIKSSYNKVIDFFYKYSIFISYIILLIFAINDYLKNVKNYKLKLHLIILSSIFIVIMLISMIGIFFNKTEETANPTTPMSDESEKEQSLADIISIVFKNIFTKTIIAFTKKTIFASSKKSSK